jgi:hypothetical protein
MKVNFFTSNITMFLVMFAVGAEALIGFLYIFCISDEILHAYSTLY